MPDMGFYEGHLKASIMHVLRKDTRAVRAMSIRNGLSVEMIICKPLLKDEQKFEFISDKANEVSVDGEKDVRPIGNKKAKALKRRHAEDDDLESLAGEQVKLARLEVVEEGKSRRLLEKCWRRRKRRMKRRNWQGFGFS
ncbi:hypothetical protein BDB00DRAFT_792551 [Zychaea mexicana]|uniref:uncharacterized protein n=1 Tax=Zychaea mexicana TaxID=64656 RepID=UPI0022FDFB29|nr:uncharacterized protein BDB00DRAFT_792551 [Zychaea mexicana]KAI9484888.1 hypothetical protein BDB00DRAFT_792551 [Zychaea mexicana]